MVLSVEYFGIGIPLCWTVLKKGGTSSTSDRVSILKKVIKSLGKENIRVLLADREFIGEEWFRFLIEQNRGVLVFLNAWVTYSFKIDLLSNSLLGSSPK